MQSSSVLTWILDKHRASDLSHTPIKEQTQTVLKTVPRDFKFVFDDFLPSPHHDHRDKIREMLERKDMYRRRAIMEIPEFYVGTIMAVTVGDQFAAKKSSRFVGICINRVMNGLRSKFTLRNHIDGDGVEVKYDLYCPLLQSIEILKLEKRLDDELLYLRDCPPEYSTIPFDMEPVVLPHGSGVPLNTLKVPIGPKPWEQKWDRKDFKGLEILNKKLSRNALKKMAISAKPWEKYDLMKTYRESLTDEEVERVMTEVAINKQKIDKERESKKARLRKTEDKINVQ